MATSIWWWPNTVIIRSTDISQHIETWMKWPIMTKLYNGIRRHWPKCINQISGFNIQLIIHRMKNRNWYDPIFQFPLNIYWWILCADHREISCLLILHIELKLLPIIYWTYNNIYIYMYIYVYIFKWFRILRNISATNHTTIGCLKY